MALLATVIGASSPVLAWETISPERVGMDQAKLEEAKQYALTGGGSGCVVRGGRLVLTWGDQKQRYDLYSSTKSIAVTALGLAVADGKVGLHDKALKHLPTVGVPPESNEGTGWLDKLTLWHLATQTGGFEKTRGWCKQLHEPGTAWIYSDGGPNWLSDCLTIAYGCDLLELMDERVFRPLGISVGNTLQGGSDDLYWGFNDLRPPQLSGLNRRPFGAGIHSNVEAMAKLGYLYLRRGRWEGKQLLSEDFVDLARRSHPEVSGLPLGSDEELTRPGAPQHYGLLWWNNADGAMQGVPRDAYWANGLKDSLIVVIPSLDIVVARAGDYWAPRNDPKRNDAYSNILRPFLLPICESVARGAPYAPSAAITSLTWAPVESVVCPALRADNWPVTWADDGDLYTAWGDGWGFASEYPPDKKLSLGFCRVRGTPPDVTGGNIPSDGEQPGSGPRGKKASGMLMVDGVLYLWVRNANLKGEQSQLAWSTDHARTWQWADWKWEEFGYPCFLNFGQNYAGALDHYVYAYSPDTPSAYVPTDRVILMRAPKDRLQNQSAYEFLQELGANGQPMWTKGRAERGAVFWFPGGCNRLDVTYCAPLKRYLLVMRSRDVKAGDAHIDLGVGGSFGIYDAPEPWGPWTTAYFSRQWEGTPLTQLQYWQGWGESAHLPSKWMSADGKELHLLFAGGPGGFAVRQADLTVADEEVHTP